MKELELKYGCNPNQKPARLSMDQGELPLEVLNGRPGYINFMDALNSWQLVRALKKSTGPARRRLLQARLSRRSRPGPAPVRYRAAHLFRSRRGPVPYRLRLYPGPRCRPAVLLRGLGRPV